MLEKIDLTKKLEKQSYREKMEALELELGRLQRECHAYKIPVMIVLEGFGASGKGVQIGKLIQALDPRGFRVHAITGETEEEQKYPFLRSSGSRHRKMERLRFTIRVGTGEYLRIVFRETQRRRSWKIPMQQSVLLKNS